MVTLIATESKQILNMILQIAVTAEIFVLQEEFVMAMEHVLDLLGGHNVMVSGQIRFPAQVTADNAATDVLILKSAAMRFVKMASAIHGVEKFW